MGFYGAGGETDELWAFEEELPLNVPVEFFAEASYCISPGLSHQKVACLYSNCFLFAAENYAIGQVNGARPAAVKVQMNV